MKYLLPPGIVAALLIIMLPLVVGAAAPSYRTAAIERGDIVATVSATGTLNAVILVDVGSQISGQVRDLLADFNSEVKQGDVLARIDPDIYEAKVSAAQADLDVTRAALAVQEAQIAKSRADLENAGADFTQLKAQAAKAQLAVDDARHDHDRNKPLYERQVISAQAWDKFVNIYQQAEAQLLAARAQEQAQLAQISSVEAALKMAEAQRASIEAQIMQKQAALRQAQIDLDHTYIRAPVDGVVVNRAINRGQTVAATLQAPTLFTVAQDLTQMQVDSSVAEADVGRVALGQASAFTVDAYPGRTFTGRVLQIRKAPQIVQNVVTYDVVVSADNPRRELLPGMTANLGIVTASKSGVLTVPNAALRWHPPVAPERAAPAPAAGAESQPGLPGRAYVLGPDGQPHAVALRLGITDGSATEILAGELKQGDQVITGGGPSSTTPQSSLPRLF